MRVHPENPDSTSPAEWAKAFLESHPDTQANPLTLMAWFHNAIEAGYNCRERNLELDI